MFAIRMQDYPLLRDDLAGLRLAENLVLRQVLGRLYVVELRVARLMVEAAEVALAVVLAVAVASLVSRVLELGAVALVVSSLFDLPKTVLMDLGPVAETVVVSVVARSSDMGGVVVLVAPHPLATVPGEVVVVVAPQAKVYLTTNVVPARAPVVQATAASPMPTQDSCPSCVARI